MAQQRPRSQLTEPQAAFIEGKLSGLSDNAAAVAAGSRNSSNFTASSTIKEQLTAARRWLTDTTQIKRLRVALKEVGYKIYSARGRGNSYYALQRQIMR